MSLKTVEHYVEVGFEEGLQIEAVLFPEEHLPNRRHEYRTVDDVRVIGYEAVSELTRRYPTLHELLPDADLSAENFSVVELDQFREIRSLGNQQPRDLAVPPLLSLADSARRDPTAVRQPHAAVDGKRRDK